MNIEWQMTRGQGCNAHAAAPDDNHRLYVFEWHDGYIEAHYLKLEPVTVGTSFVYTKASKTPVERVKEDLITAFENYLKKVVDDTGSDGKVAAL